MRISTLIVMAFALSVSVAACSRPTPEPPSVQVSASDLLLAFQEDETAARQRFEGTLLVISGEIASFWGAGPPGAKPAITFRTDSGGIVNCSGDFPPPNTGGDGDRYATGKQITVSCPGANVRFFELNDSLEIWDCR